MVELRIAAERWLQRNTLRNASRSEDVEQSVPHEKPCGTPASLGAQNETPSVPLFHAIGVEQRNTAPKNASKAEHPAEHFAEQAEWDRVIAVIAAEPAPHLVARREWESAKARAIAWARRYRVELAAAGWRPLQVLDFDPDAWFRLDRRGPAWFLADEEPLLIGRDLIRVRKRNGSVLSFKRRSDEQ